MSEREMPDENEGNMLKRVSEGALSDMAEQIV